MVDFRSLPDPIWRVLKFPERLFRLGFGPRFVLLLTTIGRKSGRRYVTPLQYEEQNNVIYVASARGRKADWYQNIKANPNVAVQIKSNYFRGIAHQIENPKQITKYLELRIKNHPRMMGAMLQAEGLSKSPSLVDLETLAKKITLVGITRHSVA
ncbi:MAG: nitroreductase family deazaflavin-dependent oxidoreductase [Candidatus Heimdallarchaeota archaeon]